MDALARELSIKEPKDWKRVKMKAMLEREGGRALLARNGNSVFNVIRRAYGDQEWAHDARTCREKLPRGYWDSMERRREFFSEMEEKTAQ